MEQNEQLQESMDDLMVMESVEMDTFSEGKVAPIHYLKSAVKGNSSSEIADLKAEIEKAGKDKSALKTISRRIGNRLAQSDSAMRGGFHSFAQGFGAGSLLHPVVGVGVGAYRHTRSKKERSQEELQSHKAELEQLDKIVKQKLSE